MKKKKPFGAPETISEAIYKYLKKAIIEGVLKPNQRIQEKEIAQLFGVSTTPAREARRVLRLLLLRRRQHGSGLLELGLHRCARFIKEELDPGVGRSL